MRIGVAQLAADSIDPSSTVHYETYVDRAYSAGCNWVVFPELSDSGYNLHVSSPVANDHQNGLARMAQQRGLWIFAGMRRSGSPLDYNALMVFSPSGKGMPAYHKMHLFAHGEVPENRFFSSGAEPVIVQADGIRVGLSICFDLRFPFLYRAYAKRGVEIFIVSSAWPNVRIEDWTLLLRARALENQAIAIGVNYCSGQQKLLFGGNSMVCGPDGRVLGSAPSDASTLLVCDVDLQSVVQARRDFPVLLDDHEIDVIDYIGG